MQPYRAVIIPKEANLGSIGYELRENTIGPQYWGKDLDWVKSPNGFHSTPYPPWGYPLETGPQVARRKRYGLDGD